MLAQNVGMIALPRNKGEYNELGCNSFANTVERKFIAALVQLDMWLNGAVEESRARIFVIFVIRFQSIVSSKGKLF